MFISPIVNPDEPSSLFFLIYLHVFIPLSVNELTDGSSWRTLATTVCIYVLLKFMQGGGAGRTTTFMSWMHNVVKGRQILYKQCRTSIFSLTSHFTRW